MEGRLATQRNGGLSARGHIRAVAVMSAGPVEPAADDTICYLPYSPAGNMFRSVTFGAIVPGLQARY